MTKPNVQRDASIYTKHRDSGYTKACPCCGQRFGEDRAMINRPREIHVVSCDPCSEKKKEPKRGKWRQHSYNTHPVIFN